MNIRVLLIFIQCLLFTFVEAQLSGKFEQLHFDSVMSFNHIKLNFNKNVFQFNERHCLGEDYGVGQYQIKYDTLELLFGKNDSIFSVNFTERGSFKDRLYEIMLVDEHTLRILSIDSLFVYDQGNNLIARNYSIKDSVISVPANAFRVIITSGRIRFGALLKPDNKSYTMYIKKPYFHVFKEGEKKKFVIRNIGKDGFELGYPELMPKYNVYLKFVRRK